MNILMIDIEGHEMIGQNSWDEHRVKSGRVRLYFQFSKGEKVGRGKLGLSQRGS